MKKTSAYNPEEEIQKLRTTKTIISCTHHWFSAHIALTFTSTHPRLLAVNICNFIPEDFLPDYRIKLSLCMRGQKYQLIPLRIILKSMTDGECYWWVNSPAS